MHTCASLRASFGRDQTNLIQSAPQCPTLRDVLSNAPDGGARWRVRIDHDGVAFSERYRFCDTR